MGGARGEREGPRVERALRPLLEWLAHRPTVRWGWTRDPGFDAWVLVWAYRAVSRNVGVWEGILAAALYLPVRWMLMARLARPTLRRWDLRAYEARMRAAAAGELTPAAVRPRG